MDKTLIAPGSIVRWFDNEQWKLGKVDGIDRIFMENGKMKVSIYIKYDERYCQEFPMAEDHQSLIYPDNCEVVFV